MKAFLMFRDADFDAAAALPAAEKDLTEDLELDALLDSMAAGDAFLRDIGRVALLTSLTDTDTILYRQAVLKDCLDNEETIRGIFQIAIDAIREEKRTYGWGATSPSTVLHRSVEVLEMFSRQLLALRDLVREHQSGFRSEGFTRLTQMLIDELSDDYFDEIQAHLKNLRFKRGVLMSAHLGPGNKGSHYVLRRPLVDKQGWLSRLLQAHNAHSLTIPDRDEAGFNALSELRGRGVNLVADALARSTDHILSFFTMLRNELAFYVGALNLSHDLQARSMGVCFPEPVPQGELQFRATGLYDPCLSLIAGRSVVGNDLDLGSRALLIVTGANQGGKSTFLRSVGASHLMMQCGMFVAATSYRATVRRGIFTHFRREEDETMASGKLDEELARMRELSAELKPGSLLLCNESFASTNEREGSEIARQVTRAALAAGVVVFFVTHLFDFADSMHRAEGSNALFLRANREEGGSRTFRLVEGDPLPTSFGQDVFAKIFGVEVATRVGE